MDATRFRVGYLDGPMHQSFLVTAAQHPEVEVLRIPLDQSEATLLAALEAGQHAGAGLDVGERESSPRDHPLLADPTVVATPHPAGVTAESRERAGRMAAEAFAAAAAGCLPPHLVNPAVATRFATRRDAASALAGGAA
ncbi:MAG TPA: NAD(P)-dependent oxidoreductase [Roseomonas sp.]|nr:NAD(P)-dependent oxidoreductase [Roseomonas sp.]